MGLESTFQKEFFNLCDKVNIKPCPFCGTIPKPQLTCVDFVEGIELSCEINCTNCGIPSVKLDSFPQPREIEKYDQFEEVQQVLKNLFEITLSRWEYRDINERLK